jgi:broad specificity phosphatase PhoE
MKNLIVALCLTMLLPLCLGQPAELAGTTVIIVRHAEKVDSSEDPDLSGPGKSRAELLSKLLADSDVTALFATQFKRTQQTLEPLAKKLQLEILTVDASLTGELIQQISTRFPGKTVVVASHSDRVTEIIEGLGGPSVGYLAESDYDNLFVVTLLGNSTADVLRLKY